jgi:lysophospholipase L1-like esterase
VASYQKILGTIPEKVPLLVCSLIEVNEGIIGPGINERVNRLNPILANLCEGRDRTKFLDLNKVLLGKFQGGHGSFLESDGCHLNSEGRQYWVENVRRLLVADVIRNWEKSD